MDLALRTNFSLACIILLCVMRCITANLQNEKNQEKTIKQLSMSLVQ